jgi:hypothetical protein
VEIDIDRTGVLIFRRARATSVSGRRTLGDDLRGGSCRVLDVATLLSVVQLRRSEHTGADLVAVSLRLDPGDDRSLIVAPGRVRVVDHEVADRLARLVDGAVAHARAAGRVVQLDLDSLADRAVADVAARRSR